MNDDTTICVCCDEEAVVIIKPQDVREEMALCLEHAIAFQQIINHLGNYPVCQMELIV